MIQSWKEKDLLNMTLNVQSVSLMVLPICDLSFFILVETDQLTYKNLWSLAGQSLEPSFVVEMLWCMEAWREEISWSP